MKSAVVIEALRDTLLSKQEEIGKLRSECLELAGKLADARYDWAQYILRKGELEGRIAEALELLKHFPYQAERQCREVEKCLREALGK